MRRNERWEEFLAAGRQSLANGSYAEAESVLATAVLLAKQAHACLDPSIAQIHCCLGSLFRERGEYADAERSYRNALLILVIIDKGDGIDSAIVIKQLSELCRILGNPIEAIRLRHRADKIVESTRSRLEQNLLMDMHGIAQ